MPGQETSFRQNDLRYLFSKNQEKSKKNRAVLNLGLNDRMALGLYTQVK
jgi:hypothetical protein